MSKLVFCEANVYWATKFRQLVPRFLEFKIEEVRIVSDLAITAAESPGSIFAIEITNGKVDEIYKFLQQSGTTSPHRCIALIHRDLVPCSPNLRALGFADVISTPMEILRLAQFTKRHLSLLPEQEHTLREAIFNRLPWQSGQA